MHYLSIHVCLKIKQRLIYGVNFFLKLFGKRLQPPNVSRSAKEKYIGKLLLLPLYASVISSVPLYLSYYNV